MYKIKMREERDGAGKSKWRFTYIGLNRKLSEDSVPPMALQLGTFRQHSVIVCKLHQFHSWDAFS